MKSCTICGRKQSLHNFYRLAHMSDGHVNQCKECWKARVRLRRRNNPSVQEYDRRRYHNPERKAKLAENAKSWRKKNPEKYIANNAVNNAARDGKLIKMPCQECGNPRSHGHHEDYTKKLSVMWLCAKCHQRLHWNT